MAIKSLIQPYAKGETRCDWVTYSMGRCGTWFDDIREEYHPHVKRMHGQTCIVFPGGTLDLAAEGWRELGALVEAHAASVVTTPRRLHVSRIDLCREYRGSVQTLWGKTALALRSGPLKPKVWMDRDGGWETAEIGRRGDRMVRVYDRYFKTGESRHHRARVEVQIHSPQLPPQCTPSEAVEIANVYLDECVGGIGQALCKVSHVARPPVKRSDARRRAWAEALKFCETEAQFNFITDVLAAMRQKPKP